MYSAGPNIKVLQIIHGFGTGGAETWLLEVARYVEAHPELNLHIDFLATGGEKLRYDDDITATGARIFYLKYSTRRLLKFRKAFASLLEREKYAAIHDHQDFVSGWHFLLAIGHLPAIRISHLHNPFNSVRIYTSNIMRRMSYKGGRLLMAMLATKITGTSDAVMDEYRYNKWLFRRKRIAPLYCGLNIEKFGFDPAAKKRICGELGWDSLSPIGLFAGRIGLDGEDGAINQKNPEFAFDLAKELVTKYPEWRFIFAGLKGTLGERMEQEAASEGFGDRIRFLGVRRDIHTLMSASDFLIFPSFWEGLGMVVVEAQASGLRVMASDTVPREAAVQGGTVFFRKLSDGPSNWAFEINRIYMDEPAPERGHANDKVAYSPFSIANSVQRMLSEYRIAPGLSNATSGLSDAASGLSKE